jgi:hypothetical protein
MGTLCLYNFNTKLALSFYAVLWRIRAYIIREFTLLPGTNDSGELNSLRPRRLNVKKAAKKKNITKRLENSIRKDTDKGIGKKIAKM